MFGWTCLAFVINSVINDWLIHSTWIRKFYNVFQCRAIGALLLMIPGIAFFNASLLGITDDKILISILSALILSCMSWWFNKKRKRPASETRNHAYLLYGTHGLSFHLLEAVSWTVYLIPYEYLMRGLLLTYFSNTFHTIVAVLLNCFLYAFFHIQQGLREALGAFLFGLLLCYVTVITDSFWSAFAIHLMFALSNSFIVIRNRSLILLNKYDE